MIITVLIAFVSLIILVSLHELGHFLTAKRFGVRVEEFGLGYPPRLLGKKFGETLYSINLLPFGAFVKIPEERSDNPSSFFAKPLWQRALIVFNGAFSFWIVAAVLFSIVLASGAPTLVDDKEQNLKDARVQISAVSTASPAQEAGFKPGDVFVELRVKGQEALKTDKIIEVQSFLGGNKGKEITFIVKRGNKLLEFKAVPRVLPPPDQGPLGVGLVRVATKSYPWYQAPFLGIKSVFQMTWAVIQAYGQAVVKVFRGAPSGVQLMGPVGIVGLLSQGMETGFAYFLQMIGLLSLNVAVLNLLPIPAFDGGKLLFLGIEAVRKKPVPQKLEEGITLVFFCLLIVLMVFVSIKDIRNLAP